MVRTVRSIQEEARVRLISGPGIDRYLEDPNLLEIVDGPLLKDIRAWASEGVRRVLVVGLEDRGRLALDLARLGLFVTVVDPDNTLVLAAQALAEREKCGIRMNFYGSDYMKREFATGGFDMVIFFAALPRFSEPNVVISKAARELRAGGKFFARLRVRPGLSRLRKEVAGRLPLLEKGLSQLEAVGRRAKAVLGLPRLPPESDEIVEACGRVLKVEKVEYVHLISPLLALGACSLPIPQTLVRYAAHLDTVALRRLPHLRVFATHLVLRATKELGLGKTFRL